MHPPTYEKIAGQYCTQEGCSDDINTGEFHMHYNIEELDIYDSVFVFK
jgi:hypothetical protein